MSRTGCREKDKEKHDYNPIRRSHTIMCPEDVAAGKKSYWPELEITGIIRNLSPALWSLSHLRCLYLNDNNLSRLPPGIAQLAGLTHLDLSCNKLRSLPAELGDLVMLRQLHLNHNQIRVLPYELGRLFHLHTLDKKKQRATMNTSYGNLLEMMCSWDASHHVKYAHPMSILFSTATLKTWVMSWTELVRRGQKREVASRAQE
ncbi:hypothetical protein HPB50_027198 [Hyalomma asiaticum]|uniref:Uncharacterized protein n=1 Tax=Hyalomma asiaticum TaxID=266040 RepID=A0ACB7TRG1_HYAAI|nr:hypothetical protein HPB50_027198 [Hyalomma asiaticum]